MLMMSWGGGRSGRSYSLDWKLQLFWSGLDHSLFITHISWLLLYLLPQLCSFSRASSLRIGIGVRIAQGSAPVSHVPPARFQLCHNTIYTSSGIVLASLFPTEVMRWAVMHSEQLGVGGREENTIRLFCNPSSAWPSSILGCHFPNTCWNKNNSCLPKSFSKFLYYICYLLTHLSLL